VSIDYCGDCNHGLLIRSLYTFTELHPRTAALAQESEARIAALEQSLMAKSRADSFAHRSTGRGGSGNIGVANKKNISKKNLMRMERAMAKGKTRAVDAGEDVFNPIRRSHSLPSRVRSKSSEKVGDGSVVPRRGFGHIWRRVTGNREALQVAVPTSFDTVDIHPEQLGSASVGDATSQGAGNRELVHPSKSPHTVGRRRSGSMRLRKPKTSKSKEGAELLAFVSAVLPEGTGQRGKGTKNVLGVPGTPGFPSYRQPPELKDVKLMGQSTTSITSDDTTSKSTEELKPIATKGCSDDEWVNDDVPLGDDDEDSDIDPDAHPRTSNDNFIDQRRYHVSFADVPRASLSSAISTESGGTFGPRASLYERKPMLESVLDAEDETPDEDVAPSTSPRQRHVLSWTSTSNTLHSTLSRDPGPHFSHGENFSDEVDSDHFSHPLPAPRYHREKMPKANVPSSLARFGSSRVPPPSSPLPHIPQMTV
jgi:hypothetical protein